MLFMDSNILKFEVLPFTRATNRSAATLGADIILSSPMMCDTRKSTAGRIPRAVWWLTNHASAASFHGLGSVLLFPWDNGAHSVVGQEIGRVLAQSAECLEKSYLKQDPRPAYLLKELYKSDQKANTSHWKKVNE